MKPTLFLGKEVHKLRSAFILFFLAAFLGFSLRLAFVFEIPEYLNFRNIMHAHSHTAMLGWIHAIGYLFICRYFLSHKRILTKIFWTSQILVLLMSVGFFLSGYSIYSTALLSIFLILTYCFVFIAWKQIVSIDQYKTKLSIKFVNAALFFLFFSSIGIWAMVPIIIFNLKGSALYYATVQFYLHFQFNGWFIFTMLAIFFKKLEESSIEINRLHGLKFYYLLIVSCILTYALSVSWSTPLNIIFYTNSLGVLLQFGALVYFLLILKDIYRKSKSTFPKTIIFLWGISFFSFGIKILVQTLVAIPYLAKLSYTVHNFVIGFIHLIMLAILSIFYLGLMKLEGFQFSKSSERLFIFGILLTEALLFIQGIFLWLTWGFIPYYHIIISLASGLLALACLGLMKFKSDNAHPLN